MLLLQAVLRRVVRGSSIACHQLGVSNGVATSSPAPVKRRALIELNLLEFNRLEFKAMCRGGSRLCKDLSGFQILAEQTLHHAKADTFRMRTGQCWPRQPRA